jgi:hypothetical protein
MKERMKERMEERMKEKMKNKVKMEKRKDEKLSQRQMSAKNDLFRFLLSSSDNGLFRMQETRFGTINFRIGVFTSFTFINSEYVKLK